MDDIDSAMMKMFRETANEIVPKDWGTFKMRIELRERVISELRYAWLAGREARPPEPPAKRKKK